MEIIYSHSSSLFKQNFLSYFNFNKNINYYEADEIGSPIASGSHRVNGMIIMPCTMATIASIANGLSKNLIERAADVCIKEGRPLVVVPRETPLSSIHLKNLLALSQCRVRIVPAMPAFYNKPSSIEDMINFVVGKVLDTLNIDNDIYKRWTK